MLLEEKKIKLYFNRGIIVDTGPLLFLLAGNYYGLNSIGNKPLTYEYTKEDFELLQSFISNFKEIVVTPQILAEVSNIINTKIPKDSFSDFIEKTINILSNSNEAYIHKNEILTKEEFGKKRVREELKKVGVTDTGILLSCEKCSQIVLTKDLKFANLCTSKGLPVIHFDELRSVNW